MGPFPGRCSRFDRGLLAIQGISHIIWKIGVDLLRQRNISTKLFIPSNSFAILRLSTSKFNCLIPS